MGTDNGNYRRSILEMVLITGIFAIISVFILRIYLTADRLQGEAVAISTGTIRAESIIEYAAAKGIPTAVKHFEMEEKDGAYVLYFNKQWKQTDSTGKDNGKAVYVLMLREKAEDDNHKIVEVIAGRAKAEKAFYENHYEEEDVLCRLETGIRDMDGSVNAR